MSRLALNKKMNLEVRLRLIRKGNDEPLSSKTFLVRLYDKDVFNNNFLGESIPDEDGVARFVFTQEAFAGFANLDDKPDFYFVVYSNGNEIFKSRVMSNLDLSDIETFIMKEGEVIDLGTFLIDTKAS